MDKYLVLFYLLSSLILGLYFGRNIKTLKDFSTSYTFSTPILFTTLFATIIGGGSTLGIVTNVHKYGIIFMFAFFGAALNKYLVAYFVAPKIENFKHTNSIGEFFFNHYGNTGQIISGIFICLISIACIGHQMTAIGFIFKYFFNLSFSSSVIVTYLIILLYCSFGGIRAVVATDVYQFIFICALLPILILGCINSFSSFNEFIYKISIDKFHFNYQKAHLKYSITIFIMMTFSGLDPGFIQRLIIAKREKNQGKKITVITGHFSICIFLCMGMVGLASSVLFPNINSDLALPHFINKTIPPFLKGIAISGIIATIMSTIDTTLHVAGVSFCEDIILKIINYSNERKKVIIAKGATALIGFFGIFIAFYFKNIFNIMIFAFSFWGPTILVPFLLILYNKSFSLRIFIYGTLLGSSFVFFWNTVLQSTTGFSGFIPATIINILFYIYHLRKKNYA